jgi:membrane protein implicated in regulation of membrane protease activity
MKILTGILKSFLGTIKKMKGLILKFLYLMNKYYSDNYDDNSMIYRAYISFIFIMMIFGINVLLLLGFGYLAEYRKSETPWYSQYVIIIIFTLFMIYLLKKVFKKEDVLKVNLTERQQSIGYRIILSVIFVLFGIFGFLAITKITIYNFI